jgi:beta-mannosidase
LQSLSIYISNEACNGLTVHVINDSGASFTGSIEIAFYRDGQTPVGKGTTAVTVAAHHATEMPALQVFDYFPDVTHPYRFGPPTCDLAVAQLRAASGESVSESFHRPLGAQSTVSDNLGLKAIAHRHGESVTLSIATERFAHAVHISMDDFDADDQFFNLAPNGTRSITLHPLRNPASLRGTIKAVNCLRPIAVEIASH